MLGKLSARKAETAKGPARISDGGGLYLQVTAAGTRSWLFRVKLDGRTTWHGLGSFETVTLGEAREAALGCRKLIKAGINPVEHHRQQKAARLVEKPRKTFRQCAEAYIASHEAGWKSAKHAGQWRATLETYAYPEIGDTSVDEVGTGHVLEILNPIWPTKTETASRVRGRIEAILDWAKVAEYRTGENPARWRGHLDHMLPRRSKVQKVQHHASLPHAEVGEFMARLTAMDNVSARALAFTICTAVRTSEALNATWSEVDLKAATWTIPGERMKGGVQHRVPLSDAAVAILEAMAKIRQGDFIFPGQRKGRPLSNMAMLVLMRRMGRGDLTAHGFRATFRTWAEECTAYPQSVTEAALAHVQADKLVATYQRSDLFEKRRRLMEQWATYCDTTEPVAGDVRQIRSA